MISSTLKKNIKNSSLIRKMFEKGEELRKQFGPENVFDFSLGNPDLPPPPQFYQELKKLATPNKINQHAYMPNAGYPKVREKIAKHLSKKQNLQLKKENIILTCGAAGALNVIFKTILNPGEEVIVPQPFFVEYKFYIENHRGKMKPVKTNGDFSLNINNIKKAITSKTKAILINSPNNPTGKIYQEKEVKNLAQILKPHKKVYLISDEPYRAIVYNKIKIPNILDYYPNSLVVNSFSKTLSLPGERIGYLIVSPKCYSFEAVISGATISNRILGYVNAPALMQKIAGSLINASPDLNKYTQRKNLFVKGLLDSGYNLVNPEGAFYIFCQSPTKDDLKFVEHLQKYNILVVPGTSFGSPGYFRIAYCVPEKIIKKALPKFKEALKNFKLRG